MTPTATTDEITRGAYSIFAFGKAYELFQRLVGARHLRECLIRDYVSPSAGSRLLDIGCGPGSIIEHLPAGVEYVGFDLNPRYIEHARARFKGRGTFYCERVSRAVVRDHGTFDFVLAVGILHHLNDDEAGQLVSLAHSCLRPGGCLVTLDNVFVKEQSAVARYIIAKDRGQHVRTPEEYQRLAAPVFQQVQCHVRHDLLRIPYTHFIMRCAKA